MKTGILGSGVVGKILVGGFLKHGHAVMVGTRDVSKLSGWTAENPSAKAGSFAETAAFGEMIVLAVKGSAAAARVIEQLCILWCIPGFLRNQWTHAFKLLT